MRFGWPILFLVSACASPSASPPRLVLQPRIAASPAVVPTHGRVVVEDTKATCSATEVTLEIERTVEVACWPETCAAPLRFRIDNCQSTALSFSSLLLHNGRRQVSSLELDVPIVAAGQRSREVEVPTSYRGEVTVVVDVGTPRHPRAVMATVTIVDVKYLSARATCPSSGGEWIARGMHGTESCVPVMADAGKRCVDERDCAGQCELTKRVSFSRTADRVEGQCTRHASEFGCHVFIGHTDQGRVPKGVRWAPGCVD